MSCHFIPNDYPLLDLHCTDQVTKKGTKNLKFLTRKIGIVIIKKNCVNKK